MALALSSNDQIAIEKKVIVQGHDDDLVTDQNLDEVFEIDRCLKWVQESDVKQIALQFPDGLLSFAPKIVTSLNSKAPDKR